jgi:type IV pilus assembly protein PilN
MLVKINLLGVRKKKGAKVALWLSLYVSTLALAALCFMLSLNAINIDLKDKVQQAQFLEKQLNKLKVVTKEVRELSDKKKNLSEKIAVMAALRKKKSGPVRVMDDLNFSVPERAWLVEVKELEGSFLKFSGYALDFETISLFLKNLESSDYFSDVDLIDSKKATVKGVNITEFVIQGKVNYLGRLIPDQSPIVMPEASEAQMAVGADKNSKDSEAK